MKNFKFQILNFKFLIGLLFIIFSLLFIVRSVSAQWYLLEEVTPACREEGKCELIDFLKLARGISKGILRIVGVLALVFFIVGGIIWISSGGNPERIKKGKQILVGTLIGLFIVFLSWHIVNLVICSLSQRQITESCQIFDREWYKFPQ